MGKYATESCRLKLRYQSGICLCELRKIMTKVRVRLVVFRIEMPLYVV